MRPCAWLQGENGLFATPDINDGEWIASFGPMRQVAGGDGGELGYCIPIKKTGTGSLVYVTPRDRLGQLNRAHAMNYTCSVVHRNAEITHTGEVGRNTQVLVRACKDIRASAEILTTYGPKDEIGFFDHCECRCHSCVEVSI